MRDSRAAEVRAPSGPLPEGVRCASLVRRGTGAPPAGGPGGHRLASTCWVDVVHLPGGVAGIAAGALQGWAERLPGAEVLVRAALRDEARAGHGPDRVVGTATSSARALIGVGDAEVAFARIVVDRGVGMLVASSAGAVDVVVAPPDGDDPTPPSAGAGGRTHGVDSAVGLHPGTWIAVVVGADGSTPTLADAAAGLDRALAALGRDADPAELCDLVADGLPVRGAGAAVAVAHVLRDPPPS